uniref:Uncharacterized protein n=1 Tax=Zea mays TaxID=4577 RepID=A0A804QV41_MAIZE
MDMAMASFVAATHHHGSHLAAGFPYSARAGRSVGRSGVTISIRAQKKSNSDSGSSSGGGDVRTSSGRRVWRRRKLTKEDDMLRYKLDRIPFLEEKRIDLRSPWRWLKKLMPILRRTGMNMG